jgi:ADP-ribose pyrophosphatase
MSKSEKVIINEGKHLRFVRRGNWEFAERKNISGIVAIVAVTDDRKLLLVEQFRPPLQKRVIEIPAGLAGDIPGTETEALAEAAKRELLEETGYEAAEMEYLNEGAASGGICDEMISLFRARGLKKVHCGGGDQHEDIQVHEVPVDEVDAWLKARQRTGVAMDLKVYAALYFAKETRL